MDSLGWQRVLDGFPPISVALLSLTRRTGVGEDSGVSYEPTRWFSSGDKGVMVMVKRKG